MSSALIHSVREDNTQLEATEAQGIAMPTLSFGLGMVRDWSTQMPFIDIMKSSRPWNGNVGSWGGRTNGELTREGVFDESGWATEVPDDLRSLGTIWVWDKNSLAAEGRKGDYVVKYDGEGDIRIGGTVKDVVYGDGEITFNNYSGSTMWIKIFDTDPDETGEYVRNISVVKKEQVDLYEAGAIFNPEWIDLVKDSNQIRFLDWMGANSSGENDWDLRGEVDDNNYWSSNVPVEIMVDLANQIGSDPWFTLPHLVDDDYVRNFAEYVRDNLDPALKAHVEFSNEAWNWSFQQIRHFADKAEEEWGRADPSQYYVKRATEVMQIWDEVFANESDERLVKVLGGQTFNTFLTGKLLNPTLWEQNEPDTAIKPSEIFDAFAVTTYFGSADTSNIDLRNSLLEAIVDPNIDEFAFLAERLRDPDHPLSIPHIAEKLSLQKQLVEAEGLDLIAYEGGQHVHQSYNSANMTAEEQSQLQSFLTEFVRSEEMAELYGELWDVWRDVGSGPFMQFQDVGVPSRSGSWGTYASLDDSTPRSELLEGLNAAELPWWNDQREADAFQHGLTEQGTDFADTLVGTSKRDLLLGGAGDDILFGGEGDDGLHGGDGWDIAEFNGTEHEYTINDYGSYQTIAGPDGFDRLVDIEELRFSPDGGAQIENVEIEGKGQHIKEGDVSLSASITSEAGTAITSINRWSKTGKELGVDKEKAAYAVYETKSGVSFDGELVYGNYWSVQENRSKKGGALLGDSAVDTALEFGAILEISGNIRGSKHQDYFEGRYHDDNFSGGLSRDYMTGRGGDDLLDGGAGWDTLFGGGGSDTLLGGMGQDNVVGGSGDDLLDGGEMNDRLTGKSGADTFRFGDNFGSDRIADFEVGIDRLSFVDHSEANDISDLSLNQVGEHLMIADENGNEVRLWQVNEADLSPGDFLF